MHFIVEIKLIPIIGPTRYVGPKFKLVHDREKAHLFSHREDAEHLAKKYGPLAKVIEVS